MPFSSYLSLYTTYHSISATDIGVSFLRISATFPFLILITLSAIGAIAELWVITMTVIPFSLHISCNNFKIALPVW